VRRCPPAVLAVLAGAAATACGAGRAGRVPGGAGPLRGYVLVVPGREPFDTALGALLRKRGFRVLTSVRGGGKPAAALVRFTFRDASTESGRWLYARFFDTRSGLLVAAASIPLDTLPDDPGLHARLLVEALLAPSAGDH
jgi:hypothetical protein